MKPTLSAIQISDFCFELSLVVKAGIPLSEGVGLLAVGERDKALQARLRAITQSLELGEPLSAALRASGLFPSYLTDMCAVGEETGRSEQVLSALAAYYERRASIAKTIRRAVFYPVLLLVVMLFVVGLLVTKVMPIFADVFARLGGSMSPAAMAILKIGAWLNRWWLIPAAVLVLLAAAIVAAAKIPAVRRWFADRGISRKLAQTVASARFASVMAMTMAGGLAVEESLAMAESVTDSRAMREKIAACRTSCESGRNFGEAIGESGVLKPMDAQKLAIGLRTGCGDAVMEEIARRGEQAVADETDAMLARVEPAIVIVMVLLVAVILVSVMLPLMSVMATL